MIMALEKIKTEGGKRNGKDRWCPRVIAKHSANRRRRANDKKVVKENDY